MESIFKALSDPTRLRILALLAQGECCVCELEGALQLSQPNISRQVNLLKTSGLLQSRKQAQWAFYQISSDFINTKPGLWMYLLEQFPKLPTYEEDRVRLLDRQENKCV
ncbi:MAG TPA: metalloregulator ArsR/SmtB family transcription factor [Anaerolineaceae bacterium]|nr:metalloregulator ArsR/SmtB family transcription factor [Anaerolineaceae bacterium]